MICRWPQLGSKHSSLTRGATISSLLDFQLSRTQVAGAVATEMDGSAGQRSKSVECSVQKSFNEDLGVSIKSSDISVAHHLKKCPNSNEAGPPTTIVRFTNRKASQRNSLCSPLESTYQEYQEWTENLHQLRSKQDHLHCSSRHVSSSILNKYSMLGHPAAAYTSNSLMIHAAGRKRYLHPRT